MTRVGRVSPHNVIFTAGRASPYVARTSNGISNAPSPRSTTSNVCFFAAIEPDSSSVRRPHDRLVPHVLGAHHVHDLLGEVLDVVADPLEVAAHRRQRQHARHG